MDRFKGTPGPWGLETDSVNSILIVDYDHVEICGAIAVNDQDLLTEREWENSRLIAAAPDLLEALQSCRNAMEHGDPNEKSTKAVWVRIIDDAKAAINKALGKEPENG